MHLTISALLCIVACTVSCAMGELMPEDRSLNNDEVGDTAPRKRAINVAVEVEGGKKAGGDKGGNDDGEPAASGDGYTLVTAAPASAPAMKQNDPYDNVPPPQSSFAATTEEASVGETICTDDFEDALFCEDVECSPRTVERVYVMCRVMDNGEWDYCEFKQVTKENEGETEVCLGGVEKGRLATRDVKCGVPVCTTTVVSPVPEDYRSMVLMLGKREITPVQKRAVDMQKFMTEFDVMLTVDMSEFFAKEYEIVFEDFLGNSNECHFAVTQLLSDQFVCETGNLVGTNRGVTSVPSDLLAPEHFFTDVFERISINGFDMDPYNKYSTAIMMFNVHVNRIQCDGYFNRFERETDDFVFGLKECKYI